MFQFNLSKICVALASITTIGDAIAISERGFESPKSCKCVPDQPCWPSSSDWTFLNNTVQGKLIATQPIAISCYPGAQQNLNTCIYVDQQWSNASFQSNDPVGLSYPIDASCLPVNFTAGETPGNCTIGSNPRYAVNATSASDVSAAVTFAKKHNIRLVVKTTGHDILGRSNGYGSLEVWLRHLRTGISYQDKFKSEAACTLTNWTGSAFKIGGGYTWRDVYPMAAAKNLIVVGGGTPTVGCIGGWMQGGGHGPASRSFGLGADQVLEATVVLADGTVVTANPCQHSDLFFAIRGGGPGTYGVVTSTTIKAWPMVSVAVQHLAIAPLTTNTSALLDAVAILYSAFPDLSDAGFAGYGSWGTEAVTPFFANFYAGYVHGIYMFNKTIEEAQSTFASTSTRLAAYNNTSLFVSETYVSYKDYWTFYQAESGVEPPVGTASALGSRLFDRKAVQSDKTALRAMMDVIAGKSGEYTANVLELVSGGQVSKDASDPYSGVLSAWRKSYFNHIVARGWAPTATSATKTAVLEDITYNKVVAMKQVANDTGTYMNEGDRLDPTFELDFYGIHYSQFRAIKHKYDPCDLFYCPTCVGSREWVVENSGQLCPSA